MNAQWGVDISKMALKSNFKLTEDVEKYREAFAGDGFWNGTIDLVGGFGQDILKLAGQKKFGLGVFATTALGDLTTDDNTYSPFDAMRDTWGDFLNYDIVPSSKDKKFNITDGEGNFNSESGKAYDVNARNWIKSGFNMLPFTLEIIRSVKKGDFTGYREGMGKMLSIILRQGF